MRETASVGFNVCDAHSQLTPCEMVRTTENIGCVKDRAYAGDPYSALRDPAIFSHRDSCGWSPRWIGRRGAFSNLCDTPQTLCAQKRQDNTTQDSCRTALSPVQAHTHTLWNRTLSPPVQHSSTHGTCTQSVARDTALTVEAAVLFENVWIHAGCTAQALPPFVPSASVRFRLLSLFCLTMTEATELSQQVSVGEGLRGHREARCRLRDGVRCDCDAHNS